MRLLDILPQPVRLDEKVVGGLAIGYHRTRNLKNTETIGDTGFKAGDGAMYGRGVYLTYAFDDQQDERMKELYGPIIVRAKVNLADFLILDADIAKRVYGIDSESEDGESYDPQKLLEPQFKRFGLPMKDMQEIMRLNHPRSGITSSGARFAARYAGKGMCKGLVFTGASDGRVIVAFDPTTVVPFSWARVINLAKTLETVKWNKYAAPPINQVVAERLPPQEIAFRYFKRNGFAMFGDKGEAGGHMLGQVDGGSVLLTITNVPGRGTVPTELNISAILTRLSPEKYPIHMLQKLGFRLTYHVAPGEAPLAKIMAGINKAHGELTQRRDRSVAFAKAFLAGLVKPGTPIDVAEQPGADYGRDSIRLHAGSVRMMLDNPYEPNTHGKVLIDIGGHDLDTGFNDGTARGGGGEQSLTAGYQTLLDIAGMDARFWRAYLRTKSLPTDLSDRLTADLNKLFDVQPKQA